MCVYLFILLGNNNSYISTSLSSFIPLKHSFALAGVREIRL